MIFALEIKKWYGEDWWLTQSLSMVLDWNNNVVRLVAANSRVDVGRGSQEFDTIVE